MGILDDDSLDARARPFIAETRSRPTDELLQRAALIEEAPSPAMLEDTAQWIGIFDEMAAAGFTPEELLRIALRIDKPAFEVFGPDAAMLGHLFAIDAGLPIARQVCEELLVRSAGKLEWKDQRLANVALARLATGDIDPRFEPLFGWHPLAPTELRAIISAIAPERREAFVIARSKPLAGEGVNTPRSAAFILDQLLWIVDLVPGIRSKFDALLAAATGDDQRDKLATEIAAGTPRTLEPRPTKKALRARAYWGEATKKATRADEILSLAEQAYARKLAVDAPELATVATWIAAGPKRQKQIALLVARTLGESTKTPSKVVDIASFGGPPIATIVCGSSRFCLVPGGTFEMGFSKKEEAAVRARSEVNADCDNHFETYEQLFEQLDVMRPITQVRVGPMLVGQDPGRVFNLDAATDALQESPFRVPSEAEWEYCARGGKARELTYRGDVVPDEEEWFEETHALGVQGANEFGLWGFGYEPELCADAWSETHDDHPADGTPRKGTGDRVVRGGAAQIYPWQACGEWHMLLAAFRMRSSAWEFQIALRFVLGIDCGVRGD